MTNGAPGGRFEHPCASSIRSWSATPTPADLHELEAIVDRVERAEDVTLHSYRRIISRRRNAPLVGDRAFPKIPFEVLYLAPGSW